MIERSSPPGDVVHVALSLTRRTENPRPMGSNAPSSPALCRRVVRHVGRGRDEALIALGAGTGVIDAVAPGRDFLHDSDRATSPLPSRRHRLARRREAWPPLNVPPASVWQYTPQAA